MNNIVTSTPSLPTEVKELVLDVEEEIMVPSPRDDRPLSPLFQRSVSEDSAGSSASTLEHAKVR